LLPIEDIGHRLAGELKKHKADYIEARLEQTVSSRIVYRGKKLESIGKSSDIGGNVRAQVKGGWGFASFNSLEDLPARVELAVKQARLAGGGESRLAEVPPAVDKISAGVARMPTDIPLADKKKLLDASPAGAGGRYPAADGRRRRWRRCPAVLAQPGQPRGLQPD